MGKVRKASKIALSRYPLGEALRQPEQFKRNVGYAIRRAQIRIYEDFYTALADQDTTPTRFTLMLLIRENPGIRSVDLARTLEVARSGMVRLIDILEQGGLITREVDQNDRRNQSLVLTDYGERKLSEMERVVEAHEARMTSRLSKSEVDTLLELLGRVAV
jgi:DNA-binding MarR family transcriptional regulator